MAQALEKIDSQTGEVTEFEATETQSLAVALSRAEVDQQITTAHAYPRAGRKGGLRTIVNAITDLATLSESAAEECVYALPRGGKPIKGPSVRLAEIVAGQYGNCRIGARVVHVDKFEKYVEAEGIFHDLESNTATTARVRRRIVDKNGRLFNDDMILVTGNAAASIAKRNAILGGVPKAMWNPAYEAAHAVIAGDIKTLAVKRDEAIKAFAIWGVKPEQIFAALEVGGLDDVGLDEIATLRAIFKSVKDGEQKVEEFFPAISNGEKAVEAAKGTAAKMADIAKQGAAKEATGDEKTADGAAAGGKGKDKAKADAKPKAEEKAAQQAENSAAEGQQETTGQTQADDAESGGASGDARTFTDDELEAAFKRGEDAKAKGMSRKAVPGEYRADGFEPLHDAWVRGFTGE